MYDVAKSLQSCPILCDPIDGSPPGSPVPGILQARTLEWVAISFSNAWKWKVKVNSLSRVQLLATPWTAAYQAPPSMGFSRQEYWSGVPLPSPMYDVLSLKWFYLSIQWCVHVCRCLRVSTWLCVCACVVLCVHQRVAIRDLEEKGSWACKPTYMITVGSVPKVVKSSSTKSTN